MKPYKGIKFRLCLILTTAFLAFTEGKGYADSSEFRSYGYTGASDLYFKLGTNVLRATRRFFRLCEEGVLPHNARFTSFFSRGQQKVYSYGFQVTLESGPHKLIPFQFGTSPYGHLECLDSKVVSTVPDFKIEKFTDE